MDQLVERVSAALAAEYPGAPNGRVREVPDRRSIRWYTTIGLVDRPLGTRGRTVLYGPRHLLQLVAIKRQQAAGRTLAEIQAALSGASEETLATVARVPEDLLATETAPAPAAARPQFWKASPAPPDSSGDPATDMPGSLATEPAPAPASGRVRRALTASIAELGPARPPAGLVTGIPLGGGVTLLLPLHATDLDRDEIAVAAQPLLDLLASRGLTDGRSA